MAARLRPAQENSVCSSRVTGKPEVITDEAYKEKLCLVSRAVSMGRRNTKPEVYLRESQKLKFVYER